MRRFFARLANLFRGSRMENELAREIESHLALLQEDFERRGLTPEAARLAARRAYGGVAQAQELHREARSFAWIEQVFKDARYGARALLRAPVFSLVAVVTLALGIGANTAIFSVVNAVLLRPLPYRNADRLVIALHDGSSPVAVANYIDWRDQSRSFEPMGAAEYWSGRARIPSASTFRSMPASPDPPTWLTVIGVVKNAKQEDWASQPFPEVYLAALQNRDFLGIGESHTAYLTVVLRTIGDPGDLAPAVKRTVWSFDRNLPISEVLTMDRVVADATSQPRFEMLLFGLFAGVALLMAAVGSYGVMNYSVSRRTREIGIRISLGASRAAVLRMVARRGIMQALAGTAVGFIGALILSKLMSQMLYGVRPNDPVTFGGVLVVLALVALLASYHPARKATRIEPMVALRSE
jgi:hypothetical protein